MDHFEPQIQLFQTYILYVYLCQVASYLGTDHHELVFTAEEGIEAVDNVIYHLESYDITTVRAATGKQLRHCKWPNVCNFPHFVTIFEIYLV